MEVCLFFFFKQKTAYEMRISDWSSDVCSSDLDGVFVQGLLEQVFRGLERLFLALDALVTGVVLEDGRAGEAEQLGLGEEILDGLVVVAELRAVALDRKSTRLNSSH